MVAKKVFGNLNMDIICLTKYNLKQRRKVFLVAPNTPIAVLRIRIVEDLK